MFLAIDLIANFEYDIGDEAEGNREPEGEESEEEIDVEEGDKEAEAVEENAGGPAKRLRFIRIHFHSISCVSDFMLLC